MNFFLFRIEDDAASKHENEDEADDDGVISVPKEPDPKPAEIVKEVDLDRPSSSGVYK